jgi:XRE family transcriptional regulator, master regulator for biofilm formation
MIGKNIYTIRKKKNYSLTKLAERAQISKSYLSNIERNINTNPSIEVIKRIAIVLDVDLKMLLDTDEIDQPKSQIEGEWLDLIHDLKESGIEKEHIKEYRTLIEFIKWKHENVGENK